MRLGLSLRLRIFNRVADMAAAALRNNDFAPACSNDLCLLSRQLPETKASSREEPCLVCCPSARRCTHFVSPCFDRIDYQYCSQSLEFLTIGFFVSVFVLEPLL